jgi:hypothetical protein
MTPTGGGTPTLPYPLTSNPELDVQMMWEKWNQIIYMLFVSLQVGGYPIDLTTLEYQCEYPQGEVSESFQFWINALRAGKAKW